MKKEVIAMPLIDMPLEELYQYQGRNPRPSDFDQYWERALKELDAQGLDYSLEEPAFSFPGVVCKELYFTGVGGARILASWPIRNRSMEKFRGPVCSTDTAAV